MTISKVIRCIFTLILVFIATHGVMSHTTLILPGESDCYFEDLHKDDRMVVTFQVDDGPHRDLDFVVQGPNGNIVLNAPQRSEGEYSVVANQDGRYTYCFKEMSFAVPKELSFNVHGIVYVPDDSSHTDSLEREIRQLAEQLELVKDEQEYIVAREKSHRNTAESTNNRVKWWSIIQGIMVVAVIFWQIFYLTSFFEVKRVI